SEALVVPTVEAIRGEIYAQVGGEPFCAVPDAIAARIVALAPPAVVLVGEASSRITLDGVTRLDAGDHALPDARRIPARARPHRALPRAAPAPRPAGRPRRDPARLRPAPGDHHAEVSELAS